MNKKRMLVLCPLILISLVGCNEKKKTTRTDLKTFEFARKIYMGGFETKYFFDFENNTYIVKKNSFPDYLFEVVDSGTFSEEQEVALFESMGEAGLFDIKEEYADYDIVDGGGWELHIDFNNGESISSIGINDSPDFFADLAIPFYNLCGQGVVASLPAYYVDRPSIYTSFVIDSENKYSSNDLCLYEANYKWNTSSKEDANIYLINLEHLDNKIKYEEGNYFVTFQTSGGGYGYDKRFKNLTMYSYDFDSSLSNEKVVLNTRWFDSKKVSVELNKIYLFRMSYDDGLFVEYTFNTKV